MGQASKANVQLPAAEKPLPNTFFFRDDDKPHAFSEKNTDFQPLLSLMAGSRVVALESSELRAPGSGLFALRPSGEAREPAEAPVPAGEWGLDQRAGLNDFFSPPTTSGVKPRCFFYLFFSFFFKGPCRRESALHPGFCKKASWGLFGPCSCDSTLRKLRLTWSNVQYLELRDPLVLSRAHFSHMGVDQKDR